MTIDELLTVFLNHKHTGNYPDATKIKFLKGTSIYIDDSHEFLYLISPNGTRYRLGVDDDGALKTTAA